MWTLIKQIGLSFPDITIDKIEKVSVGGKEHLTVTFKKVEPTIEHIQDVDSLVNHLDGIKTSRFNCNCEEPKPSGDELDICLYCTGTITKSKTLTDRQYDCPNPECPNLMSESEKMSFGYCSSACQSEFKLNPIVCEFLGCREPTKSPVDKYCAYHQQSSNREILKECQKHATEKELNKTLDSSDAIDKNIFKTCKAPGCERQFIKESIRTYCNEHGYMKYDERDTVECSKCKWTVDKQRTHCTNCYTPLKTET